MNKQSLLLERNKGTYEDLEKMLFRERLCGLITADNSGKQYVLGEFISKLKLKALVICSNSESIGNWGKVIKRHNLDIDVITYAEFKELSIDGLYVCVRNYDVFICDDVNDTKDIIWKDKLLKIKKVVSSSRNKFLIGLMADMVYYMDSNADGLNTFFDYKIVKWRVSKQG